MTRHECSLCGAPAKWEYQARWNSFWACERHDADLAQQCIDEGVIVLDVIDRS